MCCCGAIRTVSPSNSGGCLTWDWINVKSFVFYFHVWKGRFPGRNHDNIPKCHSDSCQTVQGSCWIFRVGCFSCKWPVSATDSSWLVLFSDLVVFNFSSCPQWVSSGHLLSCFQFPHWYITLFNSNYADCQSWKSACLFFPGLVSVNWNVSWFLKSTWLFSWFRLPTS